jgi:hypothetical protein
VALAVNYTQVRPDLNGHLILTASLVSVLLFDIVASREVTQVVSASSPALPDPPTPTDATRPEPLSS